MNQLTQYDSDGSDSPVQKKTKVNTAPDLSLVAFETERYLAAPGTKEITHNVPFEDLAKPVQGPLNPWAQEMMNKNILTGHIEQHNMSEFAFKNMQRTFENYGYTLDPETNTIVGDKQKAKEFDFKTIQDREKADKLSRRKRKPKGKADDVDNFAGPWAKYEGESSGEEELNIPTTEAVMHTVQDKPKPAEYIMKETSKFHGKQERDYLGRTYMHVPNDVDVDLTAESGQQTCFLPKKLLHTWTGHTKGVNTIKLFPQSGHLLLSGSQDCKVKLWDVYHDRKCLRTFTGHEKPIKDLSFTNDGTKFLSVSFDKWIKLWDTETGQCIQRFTTKKVPFCATFHPDDDKQHIFLTGCDDKKIHQFDVNTGKVVQEYDQHLGTVNTITFFDENRRFVTTSDDKTVRAWEFDIPVVIKYMADPSMHSMPAATLAPNKKWIAFTSLDNQMLVFGVGDRLKPYQRKIFRGHVVAGYAIRPSFSPDGSFITSGDASGNVWFWDWKTSRVEKKLKAHQRVVMCAEWLPHETSKLVTCSWDGTIKLWD